MKRALFDEISKILLGCLNCWNDLDVFKVRECFFTRLGIFPYHEKDAEKINDNIREYCNENGPQNMVPSTSDNLSFMATD